MRLLVIVNVYRPDLGGGVLFADLCEGLAARGLDVEVRCAYPYYPEWRDKSGQNGLRIREDIQKGVRVRRHGIYIPARPSRVLPRLVYEASFLASLARDLPGPGQYDAIMAFCPLVGGVAFGSLAARSAGCPLWLNIQDLSAEAAAAAGIVSSGPLEATLKKIQRWLFNRAHVWSSISPVMVDALSPLAEHGQPVHLIPNWLHGSLAAAITALGPQESVRRAGPPRLLYSGNIGGKQDLLAFCQALSEEVGAPFEFRIQGDGTEAHAVREWVQSRQDGRFSMHPLSDESGLARALRDADLFVITEKEGAGGSFIPSKLLPALGSGTPVLAICDADSPLGREMAQSGAGTACNWQSLRRSFELIENPEDLGHVLPLWQAAARERSLFFDRDHNIDRFASLLRQLHTSHE